MKIREASNSDLESMNKIMRESSSYKGDYSAILDGYSISSAQIENDLVFVAVIDSEVVGFYSLIPEPPELDLFFVADSLQGKGYGKYLFSHFLESAKSYGLSKVKIISHPPAVNFYEKMGAIQVGWHPASGRVSWERPLLEMDISNAA